MVAPSKDFAGEIGTSEDYQTDGSRAPVDILQWTTVRTSFKFISLIGREFYGIVQLIAFYCLIGDQHVSRFIRFLYRVVSVGSLVVIFNCRTISLYMSRPFNKIPFEEKSWSLSLPFRWLRFNNHKI